MLTPLFSWKFQVHVFLTAWFMYKALRLHSLTQMASLLPTPTTFLFPTSSLSTFTCLCVDLAQVGTADPCSSFLWHIKLRRSPFLTLIFILGFLHSFHPGLCDVHWINVRQRSHLELSSTITYYQDSEQLGASALTITHGKGSSGGLVSLKAALVCGYELNTYKKDWLHVHSGKQPG